MLDLLTQNLLSPVVMFFILGVLAAIFKSDLAFPKGLSEALSIYLLIAIGMKGGIELSNYSIEEVYKPILAAIFLGLGTAMLTLFILRAVTKLDFDNVIGMAATYGSVSIVTYATAVAFLNHHGVGFEGYMNAIVAVMEIPAIFLALFIYGYVRSGKKQPVLLTSWNIGMISLKFTSLIDKQVLKENLFGKSVILLLGSLFIGLIVGKDALPVVEPLFMDMYQSILLLFLLDIGLQTGKRLGVMREHGLRLVLLGIVFPVFYGVIGVCVGYMIGLSLGGMTLMGVLAASASYIAAPAALRTSVPNANPSIYLALALGITFPFNIIIGIPFLHMIAAWIY